MSNTALDDKNALTLAEGAMPLGEAEMLVSLVENPTDGEVAAFMMDVPIADAPHQLVAAHEAELWARVEELADMGEFDLGGEAG